MKKNDNERTLLDILYRVNRLEEELNLQKEQNIIYDSQLNKLWNKTIGHYLEEIISWVMVIVFMVGIIVGLGWTIHFTYQVIKRLFIC